MPEIGCAAARSKNKQPCLQCRNKTVLKFIIVFPLRKVRHTRQAIGLLTRLPRAATDGAKHRECTVCRRVLENETIPALGYTITFELNYSSGTATTAQTDKSGKLSALPAPSRSEHGKKLFSGGFFSLKLSGSAAFST